MPKTNLQTPTARARLTPRGKPYKIRLLPGVHLGYRAAQSGTGAWVVIAANGRGGYWTDAFAHADDKQAADGVAVLSYEQAASKARSLARGDDDAAADRPVTVAGAITAYRADLVGRGREPYNADWVELHLPAHLGAQPLSQATSKQFRDWRDGLIKAEMLPVTVNRIFRGARAAFRLAGKLDKRVAANAEAWRDGLEAFPDTVTARNAVLTEQQVLRVVAYAYEISGRFGVYVQAHAETGARSDQLARCLVSDLHGDRLMVPSSRKGRSRKPRPHVGVPLAPALAAQLHRAAAGRAAHEPLFVRGDGRPWPTGRYSGHRRLFARAARAAKLPAGTSIYALRHSSIARALLRNVPIKLVADMHNTGVSQIEAHYGRFIARHGDDIIRAALLDTSPSAGEPAAKSFRREGVIAKLQKSKKHSSAVLAVVVERT